MKKIPVFLVLALLAALPASASARAKLDPSFGAGGRVLLPSPDQFGDTSALSTATAPGDRLVVLTRNHLLVLGEDGNPEQSFGGGGVAIEPGVSPVDVAVDSKGRILVAGTAGPPPGTTNHDPEGNSSGPEATRAAVIRYLPDGNLDPSFGDGGVATTTFQLPPPAPDPQSYKRYERPTVSVEAIAVTADDRPVLAGAYATVTNGQCFARAGYVGRLDASGAVDAGFGQRGVTLDPQIQLPESIAMSSSGETFYSGLTEPEPVGCLAPGPQSIAGNFTALLPSGGFDLEFGQKGGKPHDQAIVTDIAVDSLGRLVSLEQAFSSTFPEDEGKLRVRRLLPTGRPDPAFGGNGSVLPRGSIGIHRRAGFQVLATDARNRILIAGGGLSHGGGLGFQLLRLGTRGIPDRSFGRGGRVRTVFGRATETKATTISVGRNGKPLLGGAITGSPKLPEGRGFAFARYSL